MVHYDQGGDNAGSRWFFDNVVAQHVPFDVIGLSYYPFWHGTLSQLRANLDDLAQRYQRDVSVVETQYGWTLDNGDQENNFLWTPDLLRRPATRPRRAGSSASPRTCSRSSRRSRTAAGSGSSTGSRSGSRASAGSRAPGTPNDNLTLFDFAGRALPGVSFADPLQACARYAPALAGACGG